MPKSVPHSLLVTPPPRTSGNVTTGQPLQRRQGRQGQGQRVGRKVQQGDFDVDDFVDQGSITYDPRIFFEKDQKQGRNGGASPRGGSGGGAGSRG